MSISLQPNIVFHQAVSHRDRSGSETRRIMKRRSEGAHDREPKRFQVPRACDRCKSLRRGCSESRPCRRCIKAGLGDECVSSSLAANHPSPSTLPFGEWEEAVRKVREFTDDAEALESCIDRFFNVLHATVPVVSEQYVEHLRSEAAAASSLASSTSLEAKCILAALSAQVILQAEDAGETVHSSMRSEDGASYGKTLFGNVLSAFRTLPPSSSPSFHQCLLIFFIYSCHMRVSQHVQAFIFLREATTTMSVMRLGKTEVRWKPLADNLFWALLISERSHAIRYSRPITLQITNSTPLIDEGSKNLDSFRALAALFQPLDTHLVAVLNEEQVGTLPSSTHLNNVEMLIHSAVDFDKNFKPEQKADLFITQLWLRIVLWKLRLQLGYLSNQPLQPSLTFRYPVTVANDLVAVAKTLPMESMSMHGAGITEKIYDVVTALIDVLAGVPSPLPSPALTPSGSTVKSKEDLAFLRNLMRQMPEGTMKYEPLLQTYIDQTMPSLSRRAS